MTRKTNFIRLVEGSVKCNYFKSHCYEANKRLTFAANKRLTFVANINGDMEND